MNRLALALLLLASAAFPSLAQVGGTVTYQGLWWNAPAGSESGWGINIAHQGKILFATWFTYDTDGNGLWLVMPDTQLDPSSMEFDPYYGMYGGMTSTISYTGTIYRATGPAFDSSPFDSTKVALQPVGSGNFVFTDPNNGTFSYTVNGVTQSKTITRQVFSQMPVCDLGGGTGATPNYSDMWWNPAESGWGVNLTQQGGIIFAAWFTYDASGRGQWLVMSNGTTTDSKTYRGQLFRTTGTPFTSPWSASRLQITPVGNATLTFSDAGHGTFAATVDGKTVTKPIQRQVFSSPATTCR